MHRYLATVAALFTIWPALAAQDTIPKSHTERDIEGWTVHIDDRLLAGADKQLGDHALRILANRLYDIKHILPADKVARLQKVPIWIDKSHGKLRPAQYHPSVGWLKENGYSPDLARCVHIPVAAEFSSVNHQRVQPWSVLHELAHAYHDQVLGFNNSEIRAAWARFRDSGKYQNVLHINGKKVKHYGLTNPMEFFAEMTETYFGQNDFFPFNRAELQREEPEIFELLTKIWTSSQKAGNHGQAKFAEVVKIEFPSDGFTYTLAEAARGIKIPYKIVIAEDYQGVIPLRNPPSYREPAGPSGLYPHEEISGNEQIYSLRDFGLSGPPKEVIKTLKKGTHVHSFEWDGRNWQGPSDTRIPRGKHFPTGTYDLIVTMRGKLVADQGEAPYEIIGKTKLVLK